MGRKLSVVDLFSGGGGMSYGFHAHPAFEVIGAVDAQLGKLRARQLSHFARAELELARRIAALVSRHDPARAVADEAVRKGFRVRFAPFVPADDPRAQVETALAQQKVAATNPVAFYQQLHPELDEYAAETEVYENVEQLAKMADALASRNLALGDSNQLQTVAQLQGRVGGQAGAGGHTRGTHSGPGHVAGARAPSTC